MWSLYSFLIIQLVSETEIIARLVDVSYILLFSLLWRICLPRAFRPSFPPLEGDEKHNHKKQRSHLAALFFY